MPGGLQAVADESVGDVARILAPLQVPEGQSAVQQGQYRSVVGRVGRTEVQVSVLHSQGGLAEHVAAEVPAVGEDAAAQVDEVAAQGEVAVHVDVGAVHGQRDPVLGDLRWRPAAAAPQGRCGRKCRATAHRGGAEDGLVGGYGERPVDSGVEALAASLDILGHAVQCGQQLSRGEAQVQRHDDGCPLGQGRTPMRNFLVPHSTQVERVAGRPFFMVTASMSLEPVRALHLTQKISTASEGVVTVANSWGGNGGGNCNPSPLHLAWPAVSRRMFCDSRTSCRRKQSE